MIVFNALQTTLSGGIGRYSYELSKSIYLLNNIEFKIIVRSEDLELFNFANRDDLIVIDGVKNGKDRNYKEQFVIPKIVNEKYKDAIIHYPDTMAPIFSKNKVVITIHDLAFLTRKEDLTWKTATWKKFITYSSVKKAEKIVCITNFAKKEVEKYYPNVVDKVSVVYNGFNNFSEDIIINSNVNEIIKDYTSRPYILNVSTISPRKNMDGLIKAFNSISKKIPHNLIIAGGNGWLYEKIYKLVEELQLGDRVIFTGKINDDELKYLYKNSSIFVYPSFYEGFGLPPLEAMAYGIPCIVSDRSSIPEVVDNSALFVDPFSIEDISNKIFQLLNDENLRNRLKEDGLKRIKKFSWDICAKNMIEIYKQIL